MLLKEVRPPFIDSLFYIAINPMKSTYTPFTSHLATKEVEIQCELDELMTVRTLQLEIQGFMESYMMPLPDNMGTETAMKLVQEEMSTA